MYIKINEVVKIGEYDYKAIENTDKVNDRCNHCDLFLTFECPRIENKCFYLNRADKKNIVFMKIGKNLT